MQTRQRLRLLDDFLNRKSVFKYDFVNLCGFLDFCFVPWRVNCLYKTNHMKSKIEFYFFADYWDHEFFDRTDRLAPYFSSYFNKINYKVSKTFLPNFNTTSFNKEKLIEDLMGRGFSKLEIIS